MNDRVSFQENMEVVVLSQSVIDNDLFHGITYPLGSLNQNFSHFVAGTSLPVFVFLALLHSSLFIQK